MPVDSRVVSYLVAPAAEVVLALAPWGGIDRFLPGTVRAAAERYQRERDGLSFRAGHALFRLMAARALGADPSRAAALPVTRSCRHCGSALHGKPAVAGVQLSLSRSAGVVLVASAPVDQPIGADLELIPEAVFDGFDDYALSAVERSALESDDAASRLRLWVAKEAILKATGHGLSIEPNTLTITGTPNKSPGTGTGRGPGNSPGHRAGMQPAGGKGSCAGLTAAEGLELNWVDVPGGYAGALAVPAGSGINRLGFGDVLG